MMALQVEQLHYIPWKHAALSMVLRLDLSICFTERKYAELCTLCICVSDACRDQCVECYEDYVYREAKCGPISEGNADLRRVEIF